MTIIWVNGKVYYEMVTSKSDSISIGSHALADVRLNVHVSHKLDGACARLCIFDHRAKQFIQSDLHFSAGPGSFIIQILLFIICRCHVSSVTINLYLIFHGIHVPFGYTASSFIRRFSVVVWCEAERQTESDCSLMRNRAKEMWFHK